MMVGNILIDKLGKNSKEASQVIHESKDEKDKSVSSYLSEKALKDDPDVKPSLNLSANPGANKNDNSSLKVGEVLQSNLSRFMTSSRLK